MTLSITMRQFQAMPQWQHQLCGSAFIVHNVKRLEEQDEHMSERAHIKLIGQRRDKQWEWLYVIHV